MAAKRDKPSYAEQVAARLIDQLEKGTAPWQKPWAPGELQAPFNPTTEKPYRGFNSLWLMAQGHGDPRWMTYKQAGAAGAQVRKGEKGTYIQYVKMRGEEPVTDEAGKPVLDENGKAKTQLVEYDRPRVFGAVVFNGEQIDGLPPLTPAPTMPEWERHQQAEAIMQASGVPIHHAPGDRAFYRPSSDSITLPEREQFPTADGYYATAMHELGHATGHPSRLDRDLAHPFGSVGYAKEELRAEIASLMIGERLELGHDPGQHAAYVASWVQILKDDPKEIMRAAADAEKIATYVQTWEQKQEQQQEQQQGAQIDPNALPEGWTESRPGALATNPNPDRGGIIDAEMGTDKWFYIPNREGIEPSNAVFETRGEALQALQKVLMLDDLRRELATKPTPAEQAVKSARNSITGAIDAIDEWPNEQGAATARNDARLALNALDDGNMVEASNRLRELVIAEARDGNGADHFQQAFDETSKLSSMEGLHYSDRTMQELVKNHGWEENIGGVRRQFEGVGPLGGEVSPNGQRNLRASYDEDRERRRYMGLSLGPKVLADIDGRDITPADAARLINLKAEQYADEQRVKQGLEPKYAVGSPTVELANQTPWALEQQAFAVKQYDDQRKSNEQAGPVVVSGDQLEEIEKEYGLGQEKPDQEEMTPEEIRLRAVLTEQGVSVERQDEIVADIDAKTKPGARIGPFVIPENKQELPVHQKKPEGTMSTERTYLAVPYREKDEAKSHGAKWDKEKKQWYAPAGTDLEKLDKWMPEKRQTAMPVAAGDPKAEFAIALKNAGLIVDDPIMDGTRQRCQVEGDKGKERSGSYIGYLDGHPAGSIQNYKTGTKETWKSSAEVPNLSDADRARLAEEAKERQEQRAAALEKEHQATSDRLTKALADPRTYTAANPDHPYLRKKELAGDAGGLMQDQRGNLIVPAKDATGKVHTVQWIAPDGTKGFAKGGKLEGAFHMRNGDKTDGPIFIGEGVATMETIGRATGATTVAAFTAANLEHVAKAIRAEHPDRAIVIAGDNDHHQPAKGKPNVGLETAERVAKQVNGHAAIPEFDKDSKGTDWNDFAAEKGVGELQKAMNESMVMADRRRLNDAQMLGTDGERVEEIVRQNQAKAERQKGPNVADIKSAYADLRLKAGKEADKQDTSDEVPEEQKEQEQKQTKNRTAGRGLRR